jgi:hypothetical protein
LQDVRNLPEGLQYRLLVVSGRGLERGERGATFSLAHATVEDRLRKSRGDTPHDTGRVAGASCSKAASIFYRTAATHQEILRQAAAKALRLDRPRLEKQKFSFDFSADLNRRILAPILAPRFGQMLEALA